MPHCLEAFNCTDLAINLPTRLGSVEKLKSNIEREVPIDGASPEVFIVVGIERYHTDPTFGDITNIRDSSYKDAYDITISDNQHKVKCILSPLLNTRVSSGLKWELVVDDTNLTAPRYLIIHDIHVYEAFHPSLLLKRSRLRLPSSLPWSPECAECETLDRPLVTSRGSYVGLWSSYEPSGCIWNQQIDVVNTICDDVITIRQLSRTWKNVPRASHAAVVVRVLRKSRLLHFPKCHKAEKWPYQFVVADRSGSCTAVAWTSMCPKLYNNIREGSVLQISNYTVKPHFVSPKLRASTFSPSDMIDININATNPSTSVKFIPDHLVDVELPDVDYDLLPLSHIKYARTDVTCDVAGVMTEVSRQERVAANDTADDSGAYFIYRSVQLYDGRVRVPVQLYRTAQPQLVADLLPGAVLLCCHVRVVSSHQLVSSDQIVSPPRCQYHLVSTHETQVEVIHADHDLCYRLPYLSSLLRIAENVSPKTRRNSDILPVIGCAPHSPLFRYPLTLPQIRDSYTPDTPTVVTSSRDWQVLVTGLAYRETRVVTIQAYVRAVNVHRPDEDASFYRNTWNPNRILTERERKNGSLKTDQYPPPYASYNTRAGHMPRPPAYVTGVMRSLTQYDHGFVYHRLKKKAFTKELALPSSLLEENSRPIAQDTTGWATNNTNEPYFVLHLLSLKRDLVLPAICHQDAVGLSAPDPVRPSRQIFDQSPQARWACRLRLHRPDYSRVQVALDRISRL